MILLVVEDGQFGWNDVLFFILVLCAHRLLDETSKTLRVLLFLIDSNLWIASSAFDLETLHSNKGVVNND